MQRAGRFLKLLFWAALIFTFCAAVAPHDHAPHLSPSDKIDHMVAFFTLTLLAGIAWDRPLARIALPLAAFGALIEAVQAIPFLNRDSSVVDWAADCLAIGVGLIVVVAVRWRRGWDSNPR